MYKKSIFTVMKNIQKEVRSIDSEFNFSETTKQCFYFLDKFIRSGSLTKTKQANFILKYYDYPDTVLASNYKRLYDEELLESNVKSIKYRTNQKFESLIGTVVSIENAFYSNDELYLMEMINKIKCFDSVDLTMDDILSNDIIREILKKTDTYEEFNISECSEEIEFLATLSKKNIEKNMSRLSITKLNYILSVLEQPLYKSQSGVNKEKQELMLLFNNGLEHIDTLENLVSTKEYIKQKLNVTEKGTELDYKQRYEILLEEYNALKESKISKNEDSIDKYRKWNEFGIADLYTSSVFNGEVILPKALLSLVSDLALDESTVPEYEELTLIDLQKALLVLAKHSIPCIMNELETLDKRVLAYIWYAMSSDNCGNNQYVKAILSSITHFIDYLSDSKYDYNVEDMNLMLRVKDKASSDRTKENM